MCCDGTLFSKADIKDEADEALAQSFGLSTFIHTDDKLYFQLPCHLLKGCCSVYDQPRPNVCGSFFCEPLKKVQKNELSFEKAEQLVISTLALRQEIVEMAANIEAFRHYAIPALFKEIDPQPSEMLRKHPALLIKIVAIKVALSGFSKKFIT